MKKSDISFLAILAALIALFLSPLLYAQTLQSGGSSSGGGNYNPAAVAITGGTIDNTAIGGSTPASGTFTTDTANSFVANGSSIPTNGVYLPATNTLGFSANSLKGLEITGAASTVNSLVISPSTTGNAVALTTTGSDTNSNLWIKGKGLGYAALFGTTTNDLAPAGAVGEFIYAGSTANGTIGQTVTITIASPAVITYTANGINLEPANSYGTVPVVFANSGGALPTGIVAGTTYWVIPSTVTTNTFQIATSVANAFAGTPVNTSGSQSGTQSATLAVKSASSFTSYDAAALNLPAGTWDVNAVFGNLPASTTVTNSVAAWSSLASSTYPSALNAGGLYQMLGVSVTGSASSSLFAGTGVRRFSLNATTPVYCSGNTGWTTTAPSYFCVIRATRVR